MVSDAESDCKRNRSAKKVRERSSSSKSSASDRPLWNSRDRTRSRSRSPVVRQRRKSPSRSPRRRKVTRRSPPRRQSRSRGHSRSRSRSRSASPKNRRRDFARKRSWSRGSPDGQRDNEAKRQELFWEKRRDSRADIQWRGERGMWGVSPTHKEIEEAYRLYEQADKITKEREMEGAQLKAVREKERRKEERQRKALSDGEELSSSSEEISEDEKKKKKKSSKKSKKEKKKKEKKVKKDKKEKKKAAESSDEWEERAPDADRDGSLSPGPVIPDHIKAKTDYRAFDAPPEFARYGKDLLAGEGAGMAAYAARGERIPRRGEIGLSSAEIQQYEKWGYVMSGSRHKAMEATRLRKENQILTAEEKRMLSGVSHEAKKKKEDAVLDQFRQLIKNKNVRA